jgi:hypothetical protein
MGVGTYRICRAGGASLSTRGVIARGMNRGWAGVYNHFDSYPTGQGRAIWASLRDRFSGDADAFLRYAVDEHPAGWSSFCDDEPYSMEEVRAEGRHPVFPSQKSPLPSVSNGSMRSNRRGGH